LIVETPAILLMGPTGAGKTDVAVELVASLPVEIVSVDSAMVFRGMDIGTAKPGPEVLARAPHHLIDILDAAERYSAGRFLVDAEAAMADIRRRGRVPLLVGGTMLYFRALQAGLAQLPEADPEVRRRIDERATRLGWPTLHAELARLDPEAAARIQPRDRQRIQRALEVFELTGQTVSSRQQEDLRSATRRGDLKLVLAPADRAVLAARVRDRFARMMELGLLDEVRSLYRRGDLGPALPSIRAVGYRQLWEHLEGRSALPEAVERAVIATRQLARRQLTWLRAEPGASWYDPLESGSSAQIKARVNEWIHRQGGCEQSL
jgi:tRNA dimethylallyltransferase